MANKLALTAALLVALLSLTNAKRLITTITTTTISDEPNPSQQQQCQRQIQGKQFKSCQRYFSQKTSQYEDNEKMIKMITDENPEQQTEQYSKQDCCEQLRNVNDECRCEAIKKAVRQVQQQGGSYEQKGKQISMQQVYQKAKNLPRECGFQQPQKCQIQSIYE